MGRPMNEAAAKNPGNRVLAIVKIIFVLCAFGALVFWVDMRRVVTILVSLDPLMLVSGVLLILAGHALNAWKINTLLGARRMPIGSLLVINLVGSFFQSVLFGVLSGEAFRIYSLKEKTGSLACSVSAVLVDRTTGFLTQCVVAVFAVIFLVRQFGCSSGMISALIALSTFALVCTVVLAVQYAGPGWIPGPLYRRLVRIFPVFFNTLSPSVSAQMRHHLPAVLCIGILYHATTVVAILVATTGLGGRINVAESALLSALSAMAGILPLSANGWGLTEAVYSAAFQQFQSGKEMGMSVSLLIRAMVLVPAIAGWIPYLIRKKTLSGKISS